MRRLATKILLENRYSALHLGGIVGDGKVLLVDAPLRSEDGKEWTAELSEFGRPEYLVVLDDHPDRVIGTRSIGLNRLAHDLTRESIDKWPDTFKGAAHPIGAASDQLKRVTGMSQATPEVSFSDEIVVYLGDRKVYLRHKPGPTAGSIWVVLPDDELAFIGDTVTVAEPPYIGNADVEAWIETLDELRSSKFSSYRLISARDGLIEREAVSNMARFVRKIPVRLKRLESKSDPLENAAPVVRDLMKDFKVAPSRNEIAMLRLETGLIRLYRQAHPELD